MIRNRRKKLRITQKQLAEIVGVSQAYISKLENNYIFTNITLLEIIKLSKALNLDVVELAKYFIDKSIYI